MYINLYLNWISVSPTKALCTERLMDWYGKFIKLGLTSIEVTGDSDTLDFNQLKAHRYFIICIFVL